MWGWGWRASWERRGAPVAGGASRRLTGSRPRGSAVGGLSPALQLPPPPPGIYVYIMSFPLSLDCLSTRAEDICIIQSFKPQLSFTCRNMYTFLRARHAVGHRVGGDGRGDREGAPHRGRRVHGSQGGLDVARLPRIARGSHPHRRPASRRRRLGRGREPVLASSPAGTEADDPRQGRCLDGRY